jgi:hypothetical protein
MKGNNDGVTAGTTSRTFAISMTESAFMAVAFYNVIELHFHLFSTFKRWRGLYFWSVFIAMWGVAFNGLGVVIKTFVLTDDSAAHVMPIVVLLILGWYMMVTGQSVVLYSRIHLVVHNPRTVRGVLFMIIFTAVTCHIPVTIVVFLMKSSKTGSYVKIYEIYEPLQLTFFAAQEIIISGIYIYSTAEMLRPILQQFGQNARKTFWRLIYINLFIIILDVTLVSLQYAGYDELQHFYKAAVYSIKLKLEFVVLNQLVEVTQRKRPEGAEYPYPPSWATANLDRFGENTKRVGEDSENGYCAFAGRNKIELADVKTTGILKVINTVVEHKESSKPGYAEGEKRATGARSARLLPSSSQVRLAEAEF